MATLDPAKFPRKKLAKLLSDATVQVAFGYRNSGTDWVFQRLPLHGGLQEEFRAWAENAAIKLRDDLTGRTYDPSWQLQPDEFFYLGNDPPVGGDFFPQLSSFAQLPPYKERKRIRQPNAWVVIAQLSDGTLAFFGSRITAKSVLACDSRILRIVYADDAFDSLDSTVVTFGSDFDWIAWHDAIVVLDQKDFEQMFRDIPALQAKVDANLASVTEHIGIDNLDEFRARIKSNPIMMVKLQSIIDRADMHTRSAAELKKYASDYKIPVDWNGDKLVFDGSIEKQWSILRLLDEARTLGPVTGKHWDTSGKVQV
jgi:hypothetical protein